MISLIAFCIFVAFVGLATFFVWLNHRPTRTTYTLVQRRAAWHVSGGKASARHATTEEALLDMSSRVKGDE